MGPARAYAPVQGHHPQIQGERDDGRTLLERERYHGKGYAPRQYGGKDDHAVFEVHAACLSDCFPFTEPADCIAPP